MNNSYNSYIYEVINKIIIMQNPDLECDSCGCDRPFLGSTNNNSYNTRPVQLFNKYTSLPWNFDYTLDKTSSSTNFFKIENLIEDGLVLRLLAYNCDTNQYLNTNCFVTVSLQSIGAIKCFDDTYVSLD